MSRPDYSQLLNAVKPRNRTDQLKILAAMFCLDGVRASVTVSQVNTLLRLHFGKQVPINVSASLTKYTKYVTPVETGPPRRWLLSAAGMDRLEALTGLSLGSTAVKSLFQTDVAVLCALEHPEFTAVMDALGGIAAWKEVGDATYSHVYREATLVAGDSSLRVIGTTSSSMGLTAAAIATTQLVYAFRPRIVVMVGIAAGTRSGGKQFGDVLIADPSVDYNSGKVQMENGVRAFLPDPYPIGLNPRLRSLLRKYGRPNDLTKAIPAAWSGPTPSEEVRIHIGPLGAADQVIDDESRVLEIQKNWRKLIGIEMETYGVYRACYEAPEPKPCFVSVKAVCDFAAEKTDSWQQYAAFTAARFAFGFLSREWSNLWTAGPR